MPFQIKILGSSSAVPAYGRHHSAQVLQVEHYSFLIDCGESTQLQMKRYRVNINKINAVFISHLHGDHFLGLFGLISTMSLLGRKKALQVFGPVGLAEIITLQLKHSQTVLNYEVQFSEIQEGQSGLLWDFGHGTVETFPLDHRIQCNGFLFKEKPKSRKILTEKLPEGIAKSQYKFLKNGEDLYHEDGSLWVKSLDVTLPPKLSRSYAYCSDTKYKEELIPIIEGANALYHEATFLRDHEERAALTFHSTAGQAAEIALRASVDHLIIGHYSSRYKDVSPFLEEAKETFPSTSLAQEGKAFEVSDLPEQVKVREAE